MLRKLVCAVGILAIGFGVAMAEEFGAVIKKVEDGKITFIKFKKGEKEEATLPVADNVKVVKGKFNPETKKFEPGDAIEGGLKHDMFKNIEKGIFSLIVTDEDGKKITEIRVGGKKKKKDAE